MDLKAKYKEELLHSIPVVKGMDLEICDISDESMTLSAPLSTNINYEGTAFGGSLNTTCILSGYLLVHHVLKTRGVNFQSLVIQDSSVRYLSPVTSDFFSKAVVDPRKVDRLVKTFSSRGVARIAIHSEIRRTGVDEALVQFVGRYVVS
jgi:thioesterase domain-containing protein